MKAEMKATLGFACVGFISVSLDPSFHAHDFDNFRDDSVAVQHRLWR
jgi:hypothetical protein